jgi:hypothetical protein
MSSMCPALDPTIEVTLTWGTDEDETLTVPPELSDDVEWYWNALQWPFFDYRYGYAPPSDWLPGNVMLSAVPGGAAIPISLVVRTSYNPMADDPATAVTRLETRKATLSAAFARYGLTVAYIVEGVTVGTWAADPSVINWGAIDTQTYGLLVAQGVVSVPVNPPEAT